MALAPENEARTAEAPGATEVSKGFASVPAEGAAGSPGAASRPASSRSAASWVATWSAAKETTFVPAG